MDGHECYHCKRWVGAGEAHDCWTTTEEALTRDLSEDLRDAWERIREAAVEFGEQRIYASHHSIMFSRKACYFFVRPKRHHLELCIFLGRAVKAPQIRTVVASSTVKRAHMIRIQHRDEVEPPVTDWLREAYEFAGLPSGRRAASSGAVKAAKAAKPATPVQSGEAAKAGKTGKAVKPVRSTGATKPRRGARAPGSARTRRR